MEKWNGKKVRTKAERNKRSCSDIIFTFDIEVTSLFKYEDGWRCFRPKLPPEAYAGIDKAAVPYIWMFGYEAKNGYKSVYGRDFSEVARFLEKISMKKHRRYVYVFNLAYEFQFLRDLIEDNGWTIKNMLARSVRKPISFLIPELNIEFRCAYMLTNLSLKKAAEQYSPVQKKVGGKDLIYSVPRSPLTDMSETELSYCEGDVISLCYIIEHFRTKYSHIRNIPLTSTGEVRKELRSIMDPRDIMRIARNTPTAEIYLTLARAFQGGITHSSYLHTGRTLYNMLSGDMASSYPTVLCAYKFPTSRWLKVPQTVRGLRDREHWAAVYHVKFYKIESSMINRYILGSKITKWERPFFDNGRLVSADCIELYVTSVDYDIIKESYKFENEEILDTWISHLEYLPKQFIEYVLTLYERKTSLKNVAGMEEIYRKSKNSINALFGCCCTSIIKQTTEWIDGDWHNKPVTPEFVEEKMNDLRKSRTNCFSYSTGVFCTAYARARLWRLVSALDAGKVGIDKGVVYYDTDSIKAPYSPEFDTAMREDNDRIDQKLKTMCNTMKIDFERTRPKDPKGIPHPLGHWEIDDRYREFKVYGAKRYAHRSAITNRLEITVAGVNTKTGRLALHDDIRNFKKNMIFDYNESGKNISVYNDEQPVFTFKDKDDKEFCSTQRHGIVLQPTTYNMSIDPVYEALWEDEVNLKGDENV